MIYYAGFKVFEIVLTKSGFHKAELGNGRCVMDRDIELVKKVLTAFEKKSRS